MKDIESSLGLYVFAKNSDLKYIYCNDLFARGLGFRFPQEIIGKTDYDLVPKGIARLYQESDRRAMQGEVFVNQIESHPERDRIVPVAVSKKAHKDPRGKIIGIAGTALDISHLRSPKIAQQGAAVVATHNNKYHFQIDDRSEHFTRREFDVLKYILRGSTAKQIAQALTISPRTVEDYTNSIRFKLNCDHKYDIYEKVIQLGILP